MINPVAFTLLGFEVRWYGICIAVGFLLASTIALKRAPLAEIDKNDLLDIILFIIPFGIIGARIYYIIFQWDYYKNFPGDILKIRNGGLAIHGGIILGFITAFIASKHKKINFLKLCDLLFPTIALAQAIGRWGNFFNHEAYGGHTNLPWAIKINGDTVHPTFLYESIWCFLIFIFLSFLMKNKTFDGQIACLYGILYSLERFFVESFRTDSLMIFSFKQAQIISIIIIIFSLIMYFILKDRSKL